MQNIRHKRPTTLHRNKRSSSSIPSYLAASAVAICAAMLPAQAEYDKEWTALSTPWSTSGNWTPSGQPNASQSVLIATNSGEDEIRITQPGAVGGDVTYTRTAAPVSFTAGNSGILDLTVQSFTTTVGASNLLFRSTNFGSDPNLERDLSIIINADFNVSSTVSLGNLNTDTTSYLSSIYNFNVGGTTTIDGSGSVTLSRIANGSTLQPDGQIDLGALQLNGGTLNLTGGSGAQGSSTLVENQIFVNSLNGASGTIRANKDDTSGALEVRGSGSGTFGGTIVNGATDTVVRLVRSGTGSLTLTGTNTYGGTTTISGGELILAESGSINGSSEILVSGGALIHNSSVDLTADVAWTGGTIGGNGTIAGGLVASGGAAKILSPGNSAGLLTITGNLILDEFTTAVFELNGTAAGVEYDVISVGQALDLGDAILDVSLGFAPLMSDTFIIANFDSLTGTFAGLSDGGTFSVDGYEFQINYLTDSISLTVIPEPRAIAFAFGMLVFAISMLRRRRG